MKKAGSIDDLAQIMQQRRRSGGLFSESSDERWAAAAAAVGTTLACRALTAPGIGHPAADIGGGHRAPCSGGEDDGANPDDMEEA